MDGKKVFKKGSEIVTREIGGKVILMPLSKSADRKTYLYTLNETAAAIWELIDGKRTVDQLKKNLMEKYEISEAKLDKEIEGLCTDLKSIKAIRE
jgi:hypothetical protein